MTESFLKKREEEGQDTEVKEEKDFSERTGQG
jgi:hypothetical protein